jgi:GMP synthase (glutamine-hydrolysing)
MNGRTMKSVLILKAGTTAAQVRLAFGDYDRWFPQTLGNEGYRFTVLQIPQGERLPERPTDYDAVIITGSPSSVAQPDPWMMRMGEWLKTAADGRVPVLGVCFGHQLLGHVYGGKVRRSAKGREIGTVSCDLTAAGRSDPLFEGIPSRFEVQATHEDHVEGGESDFEVLASNAHSPNQAFRVGKYVRGVQFHPEVDASLMKAMVEVRAPKLEEEAESRGEDPKARVRAVFAGIRPTPAGKKILQNFLRF